MRRPELLLQLVPWRRRQTGLTMSLFALTFTGHTAKHVTGRWVHSARGGSASVSHMQRRDDADEALLNKMLRLILLHRTPHLSLTCPSRMTLTLLRLYSHPESKPTPTLKRSSPNMLAADVATSKATYRQGVWSNISSICICPHGSFTYFQAHAWQTSRLLPRANP